MRGLVIVVSAGGALAATPTQTSTYTNVGGVGGYDDPTDMGGGGWPPAPTTCAKARRASQGPLAPFNEEFTLLLRGPMEVKRMAVYQPAAGGWAAAAVMDAAAGRYDNFTMMRNTQYQAKQQYATADGEGYSASPARFSGSLKNGVQVNFFSDAPFNGPLVPGSAAANGVTRAGWSGRKMVVVEAQMPCGDAACATAPSPVVSGGSGSAYDNQPAIFLKNARLVRENEFGCNCDRRGCGEFDVWEVVSSLGLGDVQPHMYSWQTQVLETMQGAYPRPATAPAIVAAVFDEDNSSSQGGIVQVVALDGFNFPQSIPDADVKSWQALRGQGEKHKCYDVAKAWSC